MGIVHDARTRQNKVTSAPTTDGRAENPGPAAALLVWIGPAARIQYLDEKGQWRDEWPPADATVKRLPLAVLLDLGDEAGGPLVAAIAVNEPPRTRLMDFERQ